MHLLLYCWICFYLVVGNNCTTNVFKHYYNYVNIIMIVVGLISSKNEAEEIQFIAQICKLEERIHFLARKEAIRRLIRQGEPMENQ